MGDAVFATGFSTWLFRHEIQWMPDRRGEGRISPGETYSHESFKFDGEVADERMCQACGKDMAGFSEAHHGDFTNASNLGWAVQHCIDDAEYDDEDPARWEAMRDRMAARKAGKELTPEAL